MRTLLLAALAAAGVAQAQQSPVPASENWLTGWVEAGYRTRTGVGGSEDTYRSVVNLGSGAKLTGLDLTIRMPGHRFFDDLHVQAYDWPDPYSTLRVDAAKRAVYTFSASYRNLAYFNNLPSYADPLLARGTVLNEQSFDTRRHLGSLDLQLLPSRRFSPYLALESDSDNGHGVDTFVSGGNEYPVPYAGTSRSRLYRGGVRLSLSRFHLTLEEGGVEQRENEETFVKGVNGGNSNVPVFGQALDLTGLARALGERGNTVYSKANLTASPFSWLDVHGRFLFGEGRTTANYTQYDTGSLVQLSTLLFYTGEQFLLNAAAKMPHTQGEAGWEIRPLKRVRILQAVGTDRLHNSGGQGVVAAFLTSDYSHFDTDVLVDAGAHLSLRGGYSHVWGDAGDLVLPPAGLTTQRMGELRRDVLSAAATWRPAGRLEGRLTIGGDYAHGFGGGSYFRTSLYDYDKAHVMARYRLVRGLGVHVDSMALRNSNPLAGSPYRYLTHQESVSLDWIPASSKIALDVTYEHCGYHTRIAYIDPTDFAGAISEYRENCHTVTAAATATLPRHFALKAGGSALVTSGSRPTSSYQPMARVSAAVTPNLGWFAEWRYYGFAEDDYGYENFRAHLFIAGVRFTR